MKNLNKKSIRLVIETGILAILLIANISLAATSATVAATVTLQNVSVTVADGSISYGTIAANNYMTTLSSPGLADQQTATNAGNVNEDFTIKGSDSANWTIGGAPGSDVYTHKFCKATCGTNASPTNFTALTTSYQSLATAVTTSGTQVFDLQLFTPTSSTFFTSQSVDVTVMAAAS